MQTWKASEIAFGICPFCYWTFSVHSYHSSTELGPRALEISADQRSSTQKVGEDAEAAKWPTSILWLHRGYAWLELHHGTMAIWWHEDWLSDTYLFETARAALFGLYLRCQCGAWRTQLFDEFNIVSKRVWRSCALTLVYIKLYVASRRNSCWIWQEESAKVGENGDAAKEARSSHITSSHLNLYQ